MSKLQEKKSSKWFCVVTNPNCQRRAEAELAQLGFRTFWSRVRKWASHARTRTAKEYPLLGRYMFVEVDHPNQSFGAVRAVNGVECIVSIGGEPTAFPTRWVEGFLHRYLAGEWDFVTQDKIHYLDEAGKRKVRENAPIPIGARVRIMEGEFADMLATVTGINGKRVVFKLKGENRYGQEHLKIVRAA